MAEVLGQNHPQVLFASPRPRRPASCTTSLRKRAADKPAFTLASPRSSRTTSHRRSLLDILRTSSTGSVTYQEDRSLARTGDAPRVMASLRSLAISLLRLDGHANITAANRHHARNPQRTLHLLQTA